MSNPKTFCFIQVNNHSENDCLFPFPLFIEESYEEIMVQINNQSSNFIEVTPCDFYYDDLSIKKISLAKDKVVRVFGWIK